MTIVRVSLPSLSFSRKSMHFDWFYANHFPSVFKQMNRNAFGLFKYHLEWIDILFATELFSYYFRSLIQLLWCKAHSLHTGNLLRMQCIWTNSTNFFIAILLFDVCLAFFWINFQFKSRIIFNFQFRIIQQTPQKKYWANADSFKH